MPEPYKPEIRSQTMPYRWLQLVATSGLAIMLILLVWASYSGNFITEGAILMSMPWGLVTLADIYTGLLLMCCWVIIREPSLGVSVAWCLALVFLGNIATCIYVLRCIHQSGGHLPRLMLGRHYPAPPPSTQL